MQKSKKISVVLAVYNEEDNIGDCLESVEKIADEILIVDGGSTDKTVEIAQKYTKKIVVTDNPPNFHINKQKALDLATNEWILQLDADERVSSKLAEEVLKVIKMEKLDLENYQRTIGNELFLRHQELLASRDDLSVENIGTFVAFFIPRLNLFLGRFLKYGGLYPDGVIRLVKKGKAHFPCKSVHEQIEVDGRVGWLKNDLYHLADSSFSRYIKRNNRYINLMVEDLKESSTKKNLPEALNYIFLKPFMWFFTTLIVHKGVLDSLPGIIFSFFSALRFPRAYIKYLLK